MMKTPGEGIHSIVNRDLNNRTGFLAMSWNYKLRIMSADWHLKGVQIISYAAESIYMDARPENMLPILT